MTLAMVLALSVSKVLDPIIQNGDSTIHWTNFYPLDNLIGLPNTYPLDSDLFYLLTTLNTNTSWEVLPYKRLMGMCRWMGSHFHDWIDYNGVTFSIKLLEWGRTFSDFWV